MVVTAAVADFGSLGEVSCEEDVRWRGEDLEARWRVRRDLKNILRAWKRFLATVAG
jgi:hypothetical protein